jgi:hypothetical protein
MSAGELPSFPDSFVHRLTRQNLLAAGAAQIVGAVAFAAARLVDAGSTGSGTTGTAWSRRSRPG